MKPTDADPGVLADPIDLATTPTTATTNTKVSTPTTTSDTASTIRQRKPLAHVRADSYTADDEGHPDALGLTDEDSTSEGKGEKEGVTWGKTPAGVVFRVPQTHSFVHTLTTTFTCSSLTRWTTCSLLAQPVLFFLLASHPTVRSVFFLLYFAFWRGTYDFGFAWMLRKQSEKKWIVRTLRKWGWLDVDRATSTGGEDGLVWAKWWRRELEMKMGEGYTWASMPAEYNSWLIFRQLVDIVLLNDFTSYSLFAWSNLHFPENHSAVMHILRWTLGWCLIFFNLWVKIDAHRVVKDYAWYWGDAFWLMVMQHDLVFDGVYEIAPHPMYSVGYAGYYGLSMVVGSYTVFFCSLAAHAAQFAFLLWFENPHIERTYGGAKKPLAARVVLDHPEDASSPSVPENAIAGDSAFSVIQGAPELSTPAATEGESETDPELPEPPFSDAAEDARRLRSNSSFSAVSATPTSFTDQEVFGRTRRAKSISMHDLTNRFFRKPVVVLANLDAFRASDFALVVLVGYALASLVPALPYKVGLTAHFLHAVCWRLFHSFGLGLLLRAQSKSKWLVRHYLKHYHYPGEDERDDDGEANESVVKRATEEAFKNWQVGYNISLVMTYVSFAGLAWKTYHLPMDWTVSGTILRHVLGLLLVALHIWSAVSSYEVLGEFGWLYSDFFLVQHLPSRLAYTGIYRFLNNPERSMGGAAFLGLSLISNSRLVFTLAVVSHLSHWWFLSLVERPHMERLYGSRLRKDGGLTKTLKSVADKTLVDKAGRHAPEIRRVVQEVRGSLGKVEERVSEAVEEFLDHARPMFSEVVNDTKILLQQSRERLIITRLASDISSYDTSRYSITLASSSSGPTVPVYRVGQPIRVSWTAPPNHSRKDWIGIYRLGSCKSQLVTRISSVGKWVPIYEEEYDGEVPVPTASESGATGADAGEVWFKGDQLPWAPGQYEIRYHHDGKHNVMSRIAPIEIVVNKPMDNSFKSVHDTVLDIVCLSLDSDPTLVPPSTKLLTAQSASDLGGSLDPTSPSSPPTAVTELGNPRSDRSGSTSASRSGSSGFANLAQTADQLVDPDDFVIMDEKQAKRISILCAQAFGVEVASEVVIAEPNVTTLTRRVMGAKSLREVRETVT